MTLVETHFSKVLRHERNGLEPKRRYVNELKFLEDGETGRGVGFARPYEASNLAWRKAPMRDRKEGLQDSSASYFTAGQLEFLVRKRRHLDQCGGISRVELHRRHSSSKLRFPS